MPTESEFRDRLHGDDEPVGSIDLDRVIRRARARRTPRVVAIAAGGVIAVAAIAVPVTVSAVGMRGVFSASSAGGGAIDSGSPAKGADSAAGATSAATLTRCGAQVPSIAPAADGLVLTIDALSVPTGTSDIPIAVRLTNTGTARLQGTTAAEPIVTIAEEGVVVWHRNGAMAASAVIVDLAPGASMSYTTWITPVRCAVEDEGGTGFPSDLPALDAGTYALSAAIDFGPDGSTGPVVLVTGPTSALSLY